MKAPHTYITASILFIILLSSCRSEQAPDPRPLKQIALLNKVKSLDSTLMKTTNELTADILFDSALVELNKYTIDSLQKGFIDWQAEVVEIENNPHGIKGVEVRMLIKRNLSDDENKVIISSITLNSYIPLRNTQIIEQIKTLRENDMVLVSGKFSYLNNKLDSSSPYLSSRRDDAVSRPEIKVQLSSIKRINTTN